VLYTYLSAGSAVKARYGLGPSCADLEFLDGESPEALGFDRFGRGKRLRAKRRAATMLDYTRTGQPAAQPDSAHGRRYGVSKRDLRVRRRGEAGQVPFGRLRYDLRWNLTAAGNWRQVKDSMYYTNLDVREHNAQNEISRHQVRVPSSFVDVKLEVNRADSYDIEGNLRETAADNAQPMGDQFAMVYGACNRLAKVRKGAAASAVCAQWVRAPRGESSLELHAMCRWEVPAHGSRLACTYRAGMVTKHSGTSFGRP